MKALLRFSNSLLITAALAGFFLLYTIPTRSGVGKNEISIGAASSLAEPLTEIARAFESQEDGVIVRLSFAASGTIVSQLENGAPLDAIATADDFSMERAEASGGILPETKRVFAKNRLVCAVPAAMHSDMKGPECLANKGIIRIAVGNPSFVPAGRYAVKAFSALGLWNKVKEKVVFGDSVRQVLDFAARGEVDAAVVFATDPKAARGNVLTAFEIPLDEPPRYSLALTSISNKRALSSRFLEFSTGPEAARILAKYGFETHGETMEIAGGYSR